MACSIASPRLRVGFMEGGAGWLPFWMERLDEHVEKLAPQMTNLRRRPSEIIRSEQIVLTCESEESGLDRVLEAAGGGTVTVRCLATLQGEIPRCLTRGVSSTGRRSGRRRG